MNQIITYNGKKCTVITVFSDINIARVEDEKGEIFDIDSKYLK